MKLTLHKLKDGAFSIEDFNSPQEATEAALLYTLQNLIL